MQITSVNLLRNFIAGAWISRWQIAAIFLLCGLLFAVMHVVRGTYVARGTFMIQKAQNSTIQEISAGLGKLAQADDMGPFSKDLYTEKFLLYLNSRDFYLEAANDLLNSEEIKEFKAYFRITESDLADEASYALAGSDEATRKNLQNTVATMLSNSVEIKKTGSISMQISAKAHKPEVAIFLAKHIMASSSRYIVARELQELNAAKNYLQTTLSSIEKDIKEVFDVQVEEVRRNPELQQASKKIVLEKIAKITAQIDGLRTEITGNELIISSLALQDEADKSGLLSGSSGLPGRFKSPFSGVREHVEALKKKREIYINSGMSPQSAIVRDLDAEIKQSSATLSELDQMQSKTAPLLAPGLSTPDQIKILESQNFVLRQKLKSSQDMLNTVLSDGIGYAAFEQKAESLNKRAEIQYSLFTDLSKQLFKLEMYRISFMNKIIDIEKPSFRSIQRKPTRFTTITLALLTSISLSYLFLLHKEASDPVVKSIDDLRDIDAKLIGNIPPIKYFFRAGGAAANPMIDHFIDNSDSIVFKNIRAKYIKHHMERKATSTTCIVTSSRPAEGKSFFSLNIAASLANAGYKVVIIDTDSRKQGLSAFDERARTGPGLMEYLKNAATLDEVIINSEAAGVSIVPAGRFSHDTSELLISARMEKLMATLRENYDFVVIDTAPVLAVNDALSLMHHSDLVTVVTRVNQTKRNDLIRTIESIRDYDRRAELVLNMTGSLSTYYYRKTGPSEHRSGSRRGRSAGRTSSAA